MPYKLDYSPQARDHLKALTARQQATVLYAVEKQLTYQPTVETRNRKRLRPNMVAPWELRVGTVRVYYAVEEEPEPIVHIEAIGVKRGNRVFILGKETGS